MRLLACLACLATLALAFTAGCTSTQEDDNASASSDALTSLTAAQCKTPTVKTAPLAAVSGGSIPGSAHTTLSGCVLGATGETGESVVQRLSTLLSNTSVLASVENEHGAKVFQRFAAGALHGTLGTSLTQDIDVTLAMTGSPKTKLRTEQTRPAGKPYSLSITNVTPLVASLAVFSVTVVDPGNLSLNLEIEAQDNGITVTGTSDIILEKKKDEAAQASVLVNDVFRWLTTELEKTQPRPGTVTGTPSVTDAFAHN